MADPFDTPPESKFYEDSKLYTALAYHPLTKGHSVVVWKGGEEDISKLDMENYEYLMNAVRVTRNTLKQFYDVGKVYLMYWDEANYAHWHLIPRYNEKGVNVLKHDPEKIDSFPDKELLSELFDHKREAMMKESG